MKILILMFLLGATVFGFSSVPQYSEADWKHKIILFQSTRADVEKLFGKPVGEHYGVTYTLKDGILYLDYYAFDHCKSRFGLAADWNLPEWTVTEIEFLPDDQPSLDALRLNLKRFRKSRDSPEVPQLVSYVDDENGIDYTFGSKRRLNSVRYFPGTRYDSLRCSKK